MLSSCILIVVSLCSLCRAQTKLLHSVAGEVASGNFTYYSLLYKGPISLYLFSEHGDADLYISQVQQKPTFEPDNYCLQSATCGLDIVHVPRSFQRPVGIGVYGHPSSEVSEYLLEVVYHSEEGEVDESEEDSLYADPLKETSSNRERFTEMAEMLQYENQIFLDILQEDGLLIAAKGLGINTVLLNLIKVYCDAGNLVLVLGAAPEEEQYFLTELTDQGVTPLPRIITADNTNNEREGIYLEGGVLFVSSRILVVDLLKGRVPLANVTGFLMFKAHRILESCQEAFALRLYRQGNKTGFVKAFSSSPQSFTVGFAQVERIMKTLFVKHLYLWPRFHATVSASLEKKNPAVVELHLPLTPTMSQIQTAALDLVHFCVKEIKRINPMLETDDITVENALSKAFHKLLQLQLDPVWHQLSSKTKQLVADLKTLRSILMCLYQSDSVRLHALLSSLRSTEYAINSSGWLMLDSAETLFVAAKKRLFDDKKNLSPESNPKWETLSEVLTEIQRESQDAGTDLATVLVLVQSAATCTQLKQYLTLGAKAMLAQLYHQLFPGKVNGGVSASTAPTPVIEEEEEGEMFTLTQKPLDGTVAEGDASFMECTQQDMAGLSEPVIVLQQLKMGGDALSLRQSLRTLKPKYIVMYDVDITAIRQIEIYQASESAIQLQVYFLMYRGSVEEQAYLTTLRREKEAFEYLIREKATMVIVADQDGKSGECSELSRDVGQPTSAAASLRANTRHGGGTLAQPKVVPRVIVDMREFRSELPSLLHKRGVDIEPVTLQIGDYILTPEMCVERKSINDLIGSLHSGRLYQQALAMTRHYSKPMLLIEFDQNKPFALQGRYYLSNDMAVNDITAKLQLLTLHFPKLRLVWSPNPYATAQLFHELKENREEPVGSVAASVGIEGGVLEEEACLERYNIGIQDVVSKLPGVNTKNLSALLNKGQSLDHLVTLSQEELKEILGNSLNAEILYKALHKPVKAVETSTSSRGRGRGRGFRRRRNK